MCGANASIKIQTAILQNAVVLNPHIPGFVQLVEETQTLWVFDSEGWKAGVVQGDIYPYVIL